MDLITENFRRLCAKTSDINEHLPTLCRYAERCDSALELGVRGCVSSWAIAAGLLRNKNGARKRMFLNDARPCQVDAFLAATAAADIEVKYAWQDDLTLRFAPEERFDLVFIDTWHVYGQIRRELAKFSSVAGQYIIMHDTTVDAVEGETIRECGFDRGRAFGRATDLVTQTGIPREEILRGMGPGIEEFLATHPEWRVEEIFQNNNGLMILARQPKGPDGTRVG
jgi:hypothetical protein